MADRIDIDRAQVIIAYRFHNEDGLMKALQAPVKLQDKVTGEILGSDDGNRRLAQLGHKVVEFALHDIWYEAGGDRSKLGSLSHRLIILTGPVGEVNANVTRLGGNDVLADIAKRSGLDVCTTCCVRQGDRVPSPSTLKLTITAIIGAVWLDSNKNIDYVRAVMHELR